MERSCTLERLAQGAEATWTESIPLPHGIEVHLGRNIRCNLSDIGVSRDQLVVIADCLNSKVSVKCIGSNASGLNGFKLNKNEEFTIKHNDIIELALNEYKYVVKFKELAGKSVKRKDITSFFNVSNKKAKMSEENVQTDDHNIPNKEIEVIQQKVQKTSTPYTMKDYDNKLLYIFTMNNVKSKSKIAAYDLDGTLIKTMSGRTFPKDLNDWKLAFDQVPKKLQQYIESGFKIVVFTNQSAISRTKLCPNEFAKKLYDIAKKIGVPIQAFVSAGYSKYRKPQTGMWKVLCEKENGGIPIDMKASFYCGDAAGRVGDHAFTDRFFAENIILQFFDPDEHFRNVKKATYTDPSFEPRLIDKNYKYPHIIINNQEVVVFVGFPGCGKSTFAKTLVEKSSGRYQSVCQDVLKSLPKCLSEAERLLKAKKSVIVDCTSLDPETRKKWLNLSTKFKLQCRCVHFDISLGHCKHNNLYRSVIGSNHTQITDMIYNSLKKKYKEPEFTEGFSEIIKVKFAPIFPNDELKKLYYQHYLDK